MYIIHISFHYMLYTFVYHYVYIYWGGYGEIGTRALLVAYKWCSWYGKQYRGFGYVFQILKSGLLCTFMFTAELFIHSSQDLNVHWWMNEWMKHDIYIKFNIFQPEQKYMMPFFTT